VSCHYHLAAPEQQGILSYLSMGSVLACRATLRFTASPVTTSRVNGDGFLSHPPQPADPRLLYRKPPQRDCAEGGLTSRVVTDAGFGD